MKKDLSDSGLRRIMSAEEIDMALARIAGEIIADHPHLEAAAMVGIRRRGVPLAEKLRRKIEESAGFDLRFGVLDISFYRDDLTLVANQPVVEGSHLDFDVNDRDILLVDDVLFTGRTVRAALDCILDYGRPSRVELVVLVDRGHRELPVQADYVGRYVETSENEVVELRIPPFDSEIGVFVTTREFLKQMQRS